MSKNDNFYNLKFIGYCLSQLPPDEAGVDLSDYVEYCKFQLCKITRRLLKDPIWETYNEEDIISEYYAHLFSNSKTEKEKFEATFKGEDTSVYDWLDQMVEKNQREMEEKAKELDLNEGFEFSPDSMGDV